MLVCVVLNAIHHEKRRVTVFGDEIRSRLTQFTTPYYKTSI